MELIDLVGDCIEQGLESISICLQMGGEEWITSEGIVTTEELSDNYEEEIKPSLSEVSCREVWWREST